ncbi:hypothetical protein D3C75_1033330 [compost metagenome]
MATSSPGSAWKLILLRAFRPWPVPSYRKETLRYSTRPAMLWSSCASGASLISGSMSIYSNSLTNIPMAVAASTCRFSSVVTGPYSRPA